MPAVIAAQAWANEAPQVALFLLIVVILLGAGLAVLMSRPPA
jgi:hypothetical protein